MSTKRNEYEMITLANGKRESILDLLEKRGKDATISIINPVNGKKMNIQLGAISLVVFELKCGCQGKGIAVTSTDTLFCNKHQSLQRVSRIIS